MLCGKFGSHHFLIQHLNALGILFLTDFPLGEARIKLSLLLVEVLTCSSYGGCHFSLSILGREFHLFLAAFLHQLQSVLYGLPRGFHDDFTHLLHVLSLSGLAGRYGGFVVIATLATATQSGTILFQRH